MTNDYRFAWPASAIRRGQEMALLYQAREASPDRTPITQLIAHAINHTYGHLASNQSGVQTNLERNPIHVQIQAQIPGRNLENAPAVRSAE